MAEYRASETSAGADPRLSRRDLLARTGTAVLGIGALGALGAACGGASGDDGDATETGTTGAATDAAATTGTSAASGTLNFLGWQGYDSPNAAKPLTDQGVTINAQYFTSNSDAVTKLRGGGIGSIDIITPYIGYLPPLIKGGLIEELDYSLLPSTASYYPEISDLVTEFSEGKTYCAPLVWGDMPMVFVPDRFPDLPESWLDLRDSRYQGQLVTYDDMFPNMVMISRAVNGPENASMINRQQLDDVTQVWKEIKKNVVTIAAGIGDAVDIVARGDASAVIEGWRYMIVLLGEKDVAAEAYIPSEGTMSWCDVYAIPKEAPNRDTAYAFIETMISPQGNAIVGSEVASGVTNKDARPLLPEDMQSLYPYDDITTFLTETTSVYPVPFEPEGDIMGHEEWTEAWEEIKAA